MIYTARMLLLALCEVVCFLVLMDTFSELRGRNKKIKYLLAGIVFLCIACFSSSIDVMYIRMLVTILALTIGAYVFFESKILKNLLLVMLHIGIMIISDGIVQLLVTTDKEIILNDADAKYTFLLILAKSIEILVTLAVKYIFKRNNLYNSIPNKNLLLYMIVPTTTIIVMSIFLLMWDSTAMAAGAVGLLGINVVFVVILSILEKREEKLIEVQLNEENALRQLALNSAMEQAYNEQRKSAHEFRHHLECIYCLIKECNYDEAKEYVEKINKDFVDFVDVVNTGNPIVNTILNNKIKTAIKENIVIIPVIGKLDSLLMEKDDVVVVLSNLLDNAIEACRRLKNSRKEIKILIEERDNQLLLIVKNPIEGKVIKKNGQIITSKQDKHRHGIGLSNVQSIVDKYDGEYSVSDDGEYFTCSIKI